MLVEATTVLVLRAHYTMDVFTGAVTALWVDGLAGSLAPGVDRWLALAGGDRSRESALSPRKPIESMKPAGRTAVDSPRKPI